MGSISPAGIETIDLSAYIHSNSPAERKAVADKLVSVVHEQGACGLVGHGLSAATLRDVISKSKKFFDLPLEEKKTVDHPDGIVPHRGYSGTGRENTLIYTEEELEKMSGELSNGFKKPLDWKVSHTTRIALSLLLLPVDLTFLSRLLGALRYRQ